MDWKRFWEEHPGRFAATAFREQVGRTFAGGRPTPAPELDVAFRQVVEGLQLRPDERVLDVCCGNGLLTRRLGDMADAVVGVDFASTMIAIAREHHGAPNVRYVEASATAISPTLLGPEPFDKVTMFESLQYFDPVTAPALFAALASVARPGARLYFSGVLDRGRIWAFFDTPERRAAYEASVAEGRQLLGHWWDASTLTGIAEEHGYRHELAPQDERLNTAHYRFDLILEAP